MSINFFQTVIVLILLYDSNEKNGEKKLDLDLCCPNLSYESAKEVSTVMVPNLRTVMNSSCY